MITTEKRITNAEILNNLVGIPYKERGDTYDSCDCLGITKLYYQENGVEVHVLPESTPTDKLHSILINEVVRPEDLQEGDTLIFAEDDNIHLCVYLGYGKFLQTGENSKSYIAKLSQEALNNCLFAIRPQNGVIYLPYGGANWLRIALAIVGAAIGFWVGGPSTSAMMWAIIYGAAAGYSVGVAMTPQKFAMAQSSPRYSFGELKNTATNQLPVPVIYGQIRVAGNTFFQNPVEGGDTIERLIGLCEGEIESITDVRVNGIAIGSLSGCSYTAFLGTSTQNVETDTGLDLDGVEYRHIACIYVKLVASDKLKGQPNVTCIVEGKKVNTWDGSTWSGSTYSANPAACTRDYAVSDFEAGGCGLSSDSLDTASFGLSYDRCNAYVSDGDESSELRYTMGICLDQKKAAIDNLSEMLPCFAAMIFRSGSTLKLKVKTIENAVQSFDEDDIGQFSYSQFGYDDNINRFGIEYFDPDQNDAKVLVWGAQDNYDQEVNGIVERTLSLMGINRKTQALRLSNQYFYELKVTNVTCKFNSATKCIGIEPGDIIKVTHSLPNWTNKLFMVASIEELEDYSYGVAALEYNPTIYDDAYGATIETFDYGSPPNPYAPVTDVSNILVTESVYTDTDGTVVSDLNVTWTIATDDTIQYLDHFIIEYSKDAGSYIPYNTGAKGDTTALIHNVEADSDYIVRIKTVSINGIVSDGATSASTTADGKTDPPGKVSNFGYTFTNELKLTWDKNSETDLDGYEIRDADTNWGVQNANLIYRGLTNTFTIVTPGSRSPGTYYIRAYNTSGIFSLGSRTANPVNAAPTVGGFGTDVYFGFAKAHWTDSDDEDLNYYEVWRSISNAWGGEETLDQRVSGTSAILHGEKAEQGTADSGTNNTLVDAWFTKFSDDFFNGWRIEITGGTGKNQGRNISDFTKATGTFTVSAVWAVNPDSTSEFLVTDNKYYKVRGVDTYGNGSFSPAKEVTFTNITEDMLDDAILTARKLIAGEVITLTAQIKDAIITNAKILNIDADKIIANTLDAIAVNTGTLNVSEEITVGSSKVVIDGTDQVIKVYDDSNNLRVELGLLA